MASKASMLKQGANRTGKGLFNGIAPLSSREEVEVEKKPEELKSNEDKAAEVADDKEKSVEADNKSNESQPLYQEETVKEEKKETVEAVEALEKVNPVENTVKVQTFNETPEESEEKKQNSKPASRYEKDKFLLLDIRGYRDYVEHMAKASNTSATKYIRNLIQLDMEQNHDIYEAHKALEEKLKGRTRN